MKSERSFSFFVKYTQYALFSALKPWLSVKWTFIFILANRTCGYKYEDEYNRTIGSETTTEKVVFSRELYETIFVTTAPNVVHKSGLL